MKLAIRTTVLSAVIGAIAVLLPLQQSPGASAAPLPYNTILYDIIVKTEPQWISPVGTVHKAYINGNECGWGVVDATGVAADGKSVMNVLYDIPATCAYPGAPVEFLVNGYWLKDHAGWGVDVTAYGGSAYGSIHTTLLLGPSGRWQGTLHGLPPGALIEARIGGQVCGTATSFGIPARRGVVHSGFDLKVWQAAPGPYGVPHCGFDGAHVEFFVNGVSTGQVTNWSAGRHAFNLHP